MKPEAPGAIACNIIPAVFRTSLTPARSPRRLADQWSRTHTGNFLCRCPAHDDQSPSLSVRDCNGKALVHCFAGCRQIDLIAALQRLGLLSGSSEPGARSPQPAQPPRPASDPFKMWRAASPLVAGSLVETYLRNRGLEAPEDAPLRYASSLWHWPTKSRHPAMVALVTRHDGEPVTSHATFLSGDGRKAAIEPPRLFPSGASPAGAGVWFGGLGSKRELIIAEGVESASERRASLWRSGLRRDLIDPRDA